MNLVTLLGFLRSYWRLLVAATVVAGLTAGLVSMVIPPTFEAHARLLIGPSLTGRVTDYNQLLSAQALSRTYAAAASTTTLAERVTTTLGLEETPQDFLERITTSTDRDTAILTISARADTAEAAATIANAVGQDLITESTSIQGRDAEIIALLDDQVQGIERQIATAEDRLSELSEVSQPNGAQVAEVTALQERLTAQRTALANLLGTAAQSRSNAVDFLDPAVPPEGPVSPRLMTNIVLGLILGLLAALAVAAVLAALDDTVKGSEDLRELTAVPLLGTIGTIPVPRGGRPLYRLAMLTQPRSPAAEAFRTVRTNIEYAEAKSPPRSLVVTSPGATDGKSTVAANLAIAFAQAGRRTVLVDADLRQPSQHTLFELDNEQGLSSVLQSGRTRVATTLSRTEVPTLSVLTSGPTSSDPAGLLDTPQMAKVLEELLLTADLVIIDTPPVGSATDAVLLATRVDGSIMVVAPDRTRRAPVRSTEEALRQVGAKVVGVVLNHPRGVGSRTDQPEMTPYPTMPAGGRAVGTDL